MYAITLSTIATLTHNTTPITIRTILTMQHPTMTTKIIAVQTQILEDAADTEDNNINTPKAYSTKHDLHPFSWTDIIKLLFGNEFGILPDSFLLT